MVTRRKSTSGTDIDSALSHGTGRSVALRATGGDRIFMVFVYAFLTIWFLIVAYPLIYVISASFSSTRAVVSGQVWLFPVEPSLLGYETVFKTDAVLRGYANSLFYTVAGTAVNVIVTILAAYPLSRKTFYGRNLFMGLFTFTMLFSGGLIPIYLVVKTLGLLNTRWAMILPIAMSVWNMIIARTFFQSTIPDELYEAGEMDGCGDIRFLPLLVLPLSKPIIAVLILFYAVQHWNSYFHALIYLKDPELYPLQIVLRNILIINQMDTNMIADIDQLKRQQGLAELLKFSLIVVASVPMMLAYPFIQKYFVRGVMIGALKG